MDTLDLYIYSWIGTWDDEVSYQDVVALLAAHEQADRVRVFVNSGGGDVYEGLAIHNALARHGAQVEVLVEGVAASIASCIVQAGDVRRIAPTGQMMVHEPAGGAFGMIDDLEAAIRQLDTARTSMAELYAGRSGKGDADAWRAVMRETTWYTAAEAVAAGLCDEVSVQPTMATPLNPFAGIHPAPTAGHSPQVGYALRTPQRRGLVPVTASLTTPHPTPMSSIIDKIKASLGLSATATDEEVEQAAKEAKEAIDKAKAEVAPEPNPAIETDPNPSVKEAGPHPTASVDEPEWARTLREQNERIQARLDADETATRARLITAAVADLRILASETDDWQRRLTADFAAESAALAAIPKGRRSPSASAVRPPSKEATGGDETPQTRAGIRAAAKAKADAKAAQIQ